MKSAFFDTSALAAILFGEPGSVELRGILDNLESVFACNLLEAEMRSAASREKMEQRHVDTLLSQVKWVQPDRPLTQELKSAVSAGPLLRGADLWHVACALYFAGDPSLLPFVTLDESQGLAATRLGFKVLPVPSRSRGEARESQAAYKTKKSKPRGRKNK